MSPRSMAPLILGLILLAAPALAHHSFAMFDLKKERELKGEIKRFHWSNPHTLVDVTVVEDGRPVVYRLEGQQVRVMSNFGFRRDSLKPGDKVSAVMRPLRDGGKGGMLVRVTKADGSVLGFK